MVKKHIALIVCTFLWWLLGVASFIHTFAEHLWFCQYCFIVMGFSLAMSIFLTMFLVDVIKDFIQYLKEIKEQRW